MSIKAALAIIAYSTLCLIVSLLVTQCQSKHAQREIDEARAKTEQLNIELDLMKKENQVIRDMIERTNVVTEQVAIEKETAEEHHEERIEQITNAPSDWLKCELPSSVQDMFGPYCDSD